MIKRHGFPANPDTRSRKFKHKSLIKNLKNYYNWISTITRQRFDKFFPLIALKIKSTEVYLSANLKNEKSTNSITRNNFRWVWKRYLKYKLHITRVRGIVDTRKLNQSRWKVIQLNEKMFFILFVFKKESNKEKQGEGKSSFNN